MAKENRPESQKPASDTSKTAKTEKTGAGAARTGKGSKPGSKSTESRVGGTALPGARSTQPREIKASNPQQQQAESYNRAMRRRMQQLGTTPGQAPAIVQQRRKRIERRKKRIEERKQEVKKVAASGPSRIALGRKNIYFLIGVALLIIAIIVIAFLVNHHIL